MPLQWPVPDVYVDGDFTVAQPVGIPEFDSPIKATTDEYTFTQEWMQYRVNFAPTALNTAHPSAGKTPDYSNYFLVAEGRRKDIGGGLVQWKRTYSIKPASHDEWETFAYNFIGFTGLWNLASQFFPALTGSISTLSLVVAGRSRFIEGVNSRLRHDYFLIGATGDYLSPGLIPSVEQQQYIMGVAASGGRFFTDYINDAIVGPYTIAASVPSLTAYGGWVTNAASLGWASGRIGTADPNPGQLVAEDSRLSRWQGNIYLRQTRYVLAI